VRNLKFGIEIETHIPSLSAVSVGRYHAGDLCPQLPTAVDGKMWKCERDSSINAPAGRQPAEFVSPILSGTEGVQNVVKAVAKLKELDAKVNETCGVHVTVEWTGDQAALARLINLVANFESAFYGSTGTKNRENGTYCRKIKQYGSAEKVINRAASISGRYHILNLTHIANGGNRVEFRCFSASLNSAKILGWIQMCLAAVEVALDGRIRPFNHTEEETATESLKRFFATMRWIGKDKTVARGNFHPEANGEGLPTRRFIRSELLRMTAKYDASVAAAASIARSIGQ
jgi:hypothetical protein